MASCDLETLARERPLATTEIHPSNAFYGHARILKAHAGVRPGTPLKVTIEHGINFIDHVWDVDAMAGMPMLLCAGAQRAAYVGEFLPEGCRAVAVGPLVMYAGSQAAEPPPPRSRTLMAFPAHSTHHLDTDYDAHELADRLVAERNAFDRVAVCLYWRDVQRGLRAPYEARGIECVTAGHIYDPRFLPRLRRILEEASEVVTNEVGTHVVYSVALGRPVWMIEQEISMSAESDAVLRRDGGDAESMAHERLQEIRELFAERRSSLTREQSDAIAELAGFGEHKTPRQLRALLDEADESYRRRYGAVTRAGRRARSLTRAAGAKVAGALR